MLFAARSMPSTTRIAACRFCLFPSEWVRSLRTRGAQSTALQRLLNVDGYPVLRLSADGAHAELDATLLVERFELEP